MKILIDTNVVLDLLLDRVPFSAAAECLFGMAEDGRVTATLCGTTITTICCLAEKTIGSRRAKGEIEKLLRICEISPVGRPVLENALRREERDFEDAVIVSAAHHAGVAAIITRALKDFRKSGLPVYTPGQVLELLALRPS